ncbi:uncharacterized protein EV422DRAFT_565414 [Fimicolochytrium jonesii]|uniref:uncharacterized protein n=1 Tax=Fimicolochytrium jonesii TaxID=1396493 RepID=UPI0022FE2A7B|nr:uncharacterized protein EV422DRAFT_565414 [Fimicolochytrium jonesii]KAI8823470.1 hypothetical protein EV422DRAFT_565414 [Fimicolochytrium jonesii]
MAQRSISAVSCATRARRPNVGSSSSAAPYFPPASSTATTSSTQYRFPTPSIPSFSALSQSCQPSTSLSVPSLPQDLPLPNAYELAMMEESEEVSDGRWRGRKARGRRLSNEADWDDWCTGGVVRKASVDSRITRTTTAMQLSPLPLINTRTIPSPSPSLQRETDSQSIRSIETADAEEEKEAAMEASYAHALAQGGFLATLGVRAAKARQIAIERISAVARHFRRNPVTIAPHAAVS